MVAILLDLGADRQPRNYAGLTRDSGIIIPFNERIAVGTLI
jgi:hypothetical protein